MELEQQLEQYLAAVPLKKFQWTEVEVFSEEVQQKLMNEVVKSPLAVSHPPSHAYQVAFMKQLMAKVEASGCVIAEEVYELYAQLLSKPTSEQSLDHCWRSYHLHSGDYVSLMESPHLISNGTTGLTTWQAAFRFVEWVSLPRISEMFRSKRVLELGSGLGFTGLAVCKLCGPASYSFTDSHALVLDWLRRNVEHNLSGDSHVITTVIKLDWSSEEDITTLISSHQQQVNVVIATDVVYDIPTIDCFVRCVSQILRCNPQAIVFVASTIRNVDTYQYFKKVVGSEGLVASEVTVGAPRQFYYDHSQTIEIVELKQP